MKVKVIDKKTGVKKEMATRYAAILTAIGRCSYAPSEAAEMPEASRPQPSSPVREVSATASHEPDSSAPRDEYVESPSEAQAAPPKERTKRKYQRRDMQAKD